MSRAIHAIGQYDKNTWIGGTPLIVSKAIPYEMSDANFGIGPNDSGYIGMSESPSQPMLVNVDASLLGTGQYPLRIAPQQWHKFNFLVREITISGAPTQNEQGVRWADTNYEAQQPADETELLKFPGLWWRKLLASKFLTLGIGIPVDANAVVPDLEVFPFTSTYPIVAQNWTFDSGIGNAFGDYELTTQGISSVWFSEGWVAPYFRYTLRFDTPTWGTPARLYTGSPPFWDSTGATTFESTGFSLRLFDWGSIPLNIAWIPGSPADPFALTEDIVISASKYWTYNGLYNETTGQPTGPIPDKM